MARLRVFIAALGAAASKAAQRGREGRLARPTRAVRASARWAAVGPSAKRVLARVGDVQEVVLVLVVSIHIRHKRSCTSAGVGPGRCQRAESPRVGAGCSAACSAELAASA